MKRSYIFESFIDWSLNENISAAKAYMQKRYAKNRKMESGELTPEEKDEALKNGSYQAITILLKNHPGYVLPFVKFHFEQGVPISLSGDTEEVRSLRQLLDVITNKKYIIQQLSKPIEKWANTEDVNGITGFEQLTDEIRGIEREKEAKWFINALPKGLRDKYRSLDSTEQKKVVTLAIQLEKLGKSAINRLFEKIKSMERWDIKDVIDYVSNYIGGFSNLEMQKKIDELENLEPEAGIIYSDDNYLVMTMRTEDAQKALCSVANWCINRGLFHRYADKGLQINIFNFGIDPADPLFLTGNTVSFAGSITDSHDINDVPIIQDRNPREHLTKLGYPRSLVDTVMYSLEPEFAIKKSLSKLYKSTQIGEIIEALLGASKGDLAGDMPEGIWNKIAGTVSEIIYNKKKIPKSDFMNFFLDTGIYTIAGWRVFDSIIGNDYTTSEMNNIKEQSIYGWEGLEFFIDEYANDPERQSEIVLMKDILAERKEMMDEFNKREK